MQRYTIGRTEFIEESSPSTPGLLENR